MRLEEINFKVNLTYNKGFIEDNDAKSSPLVFVFWGVIIPIISVVGFFGNILTIIVLFRREMQSTTIYFLRTLVVTDTAIILGAVLGLSVLAITITKPEMWLFNDVIYPHIYTPTNYLVMTLQMINVWVTVAVSVERYIAICHPFKSVRICNKRNAFISLAVIVIISVIYNIPRCFATTVVKCESANCYQVITTDFGKTLFYTQYYFFWMYMILIYIIPLIVLSVLNTLLIAELMRMRKRRTPSNIQENSESNMSLVLILIVLVFIFCQTPGLCAQFTFWSTEVLMQWTCVSNTLFVFNSSVNFLIYTAVGRKFRKVLLKTFQVLIKKPVNEFTKASFTQNGTELRRLNTKPSDMSSEETDERSHLKPSR